jgi:ribosomal protein S18 acetylase RimI-like enzyme
MQGEVVIELAQPADIPALSGLLGALFAQEHEFSPDPDAQARGLAAILAAPALGAVLVARRDGVVVGMANLLFSISTALGARVAVLDDFVVAPSARGAGIGSALMARALAFAREAGCRRISLHTDHDNHVAQALYRRHGFELSSMLPMRQLLD